MAIAKKPKRNQTATSSSDPDQAAAAFISGADSEEGNTSDTKPASKRTPVMVRFDSSLLSRVDAAAKHRGISRSAWIQSTLSRALDQGEG